MTVAAVDAEPGNVMLVAKGHGLRLAHARISNVGRALDLKEDPKDCGDDEDRPIDRGPRHRIRTARKDLHSTDGLIERERLPGFPARKLDVNYITR